MDTLGLVILFFMEWFSSLKMYYKVWPLYMYPLLLHYMLQGPQVSVDAASLEFGLVPLGSSSQLTLTLTSLTNTSLPVLLRQTVAGQARVTSDTGSDFQNVTVSGVCREVCRGQDSHNLSTNATFDVEINVWQ